MNFNSEEEYQQYIGDSSYIEIEAQQELDYQEYLSSLLDNKEYVIYALEVTLDILNRKDRSDPMTDKEFLELKLKSFKVSKDIESGNDNSNLPF